MISRTIAMLLALLLLLMGTALAADYGYEIDVDAMKALEQSSAFPVQVVEKKVVEECFDTTLGGDPGDALVLTVKSDVAEGAITGLKLSFVAYDADNCTAYIEGGMKISSLYASPSISSLSREGLELTAGDTCVFSTKVDYDKFVGVRAMVASYTDQAGNTVENPDFEAWQNMAFGLSGSSATTELD